MNTKNQLHEDRTDKWHENIIDVKWFQGTNHLTFDQWLEEMDNIENNCTNFDLFPEVQIKETRNLGNY